MKAKYAAIEPIVVDATVVPTAESFVENHSVSNSGPGVVEGSALVTVIAPDDLPEGYKFNASYEGVVFSVTVKEGGAKKGQQLIVPFNRNQVLAQEGGRWRDDLCSCFRYGICHPSLTNATCCRFILLGQVMTRLKLDWIGDPAPAGVWKNTYRVVVRLTIAYALFYLFFSPRPVLDKDDNDANVYDDPNVFFNIVSSLLGFLVVFITYKVRKHIRTKDQIPETRCFGCEDLCCACCCGCCVVAQMARHTTNYDTEKAQYFSSQGFRQSEGVMIV